MRSASFHFAMRSPRANEPTLSWPTLPADGQVHDRRVFGLARARRDDAGVAEPLARPARRRSVSVSVPRWLGLSSTVLAAPAAAASRTQRRVRHQQIVADDLQPVAGRRVKRAKASTSSSASGSSIETIGYLSIQRSSSSIRPSLSSSRDSRPSV